MVTQHITKAFVPNEGKPSTTTTFNLLTFNITWKWRQYNAQKFHAYFEGYGNENGRSWAHVYLKTHLFTPEKLYFTKIKNKNKKLRSGTVLRLGGDAKQVYFFLSGLNSVILKHVSVFALKQLVARILSNKYIWLLLKYKTTDELAIHSDPRRKNISIARNSLLTASQTIALSSNSVHCFRQFKCYIRINSLLYSCKLKNNVKLNQQLFLLALNSINRAIS